MKKKLILLSTPYLRCKINIPTINLESSRSSAVYLNDNRCLTSVRTALSVLVYDYFENSTRFSKKKGSKNNNRPATKFSVSEFNSAFPSDRLVLLDLRTGKESDRRFDIIIKVKKKNH